MAGSFEVFMDEESQIRFRLLAPDGMVLAVSGQFPDKRHAAAAINDVREAAGTGLIQDLCPKSPPEPEQSRRFRSQRQMVGHPYSFMRPSGADLRQSA